MSQRRLKITWIAVADGGKALILINDGTDRAPLLRVAAKNELENPPTGQQGADRPGRRAGPDQRSAIESTDWHAFEESRFIEELAGRLNQAAGRGQFEQLVIAAPPKVLGMVRPALSAQATALVVAEISKDLTKHPVDVIEKHVAEALAS
jgi:protein required for attachment to host cells